MKSVQMSVKMNRSPLFLSLFGLMLLGGCSFSDKNYSACPSIKVVEGAERVILTGSILGQEARVRLNGVNAKCVMSETGYDATIDLGLLGKRSTKTSGKNEKASLTVVMAIIDDNDEVIERKFFQEDVIFGNGNNTSRPIYELDLSIPSGARVLLGLKS